ncbi:MAG: sigma-70 family RNA polymerase sigma factor [Desulfovibrio sp.]|jgi:RNA polymerase sigma factor (sigma-70 family)|nr:sigma-70 family RNA polymerase sigma factor [Desulfovibrio sp.]
MIHTRQNLASDRFFQHFYLLEYLAGRRFKADVLAEEAQNYVLDALSRNDWEKIRRYKDTGSFKAYLAQVIVRLLEDFARKRFGRKRPPAHVVVRGSLWVRLFQLMCIEGYSPSAASAVVEGELPSPAEENRAYSAARSIVESVVDCGETVTEIHSDEEASAEAGPAEDLLHTLPPEEYLEEARYAALLEALREFFSDNNHEGPRRAQASVLRYEKLLRDKAQLQTEERLLLRLVYQDGLTVTAAGKVLGYTAAQIHGRLHRLLQRLARLLDEAGVNPL